MRELVVVTGVVALLRAFGSRGDVKGCYVEGMGTTGSGYDGPIT